MSVIRVPVPVHLWLFFFNAYQSFTVNFIPGYSTVNLLSILRLWLVLDTVVNSHTVIGGSIVLMHRYNYVLSAAGRYKLRFLVDESSTLEGFD